MLKRVLWIVDPAGCSWAGSTSLAQARPVPVDVAVIGARPHPVVRRGGGQDAGRRALRRVGPGGRPAASGCDLEEGDAVEQGQRRRAASTRFRSKAAIAEIGGARSSRSGSDGGRRHEEAEGGGDRARAGPRGARRRDALAVAGASWTARRPTWERLKKDRVRVERTARGAGAHPRGGARRRDRGRGRSARAGARAGGAHQDRASRHLRHAARAAPSSSRASTDFDWEEKAYEQQIEALEATLEKLEGRPRAHRDQGARSGASCCVSPGERAGGRSPGRPSSRSEICDTCEVEADFLSEDAAHMRPGMPAEIFGRALGERVLPGQDRAHPPERLREDLVPGRGAAAGEGHRRLRRRGRRARRSLSRRGARDPRGAGRRGPRTRGRALPPRAARGTCSS